MLNFEQMIEDGVKFGPWIQNYVGKFSPSNKVRKLSWIEVEPNVNNNTFNF
jgi:hypothetical protein